MAVKQQPTRIDRIAWWFFLAVLVAQCVSMVGVMLPDVLGVRIEGGEGSPLEIPLLTMWAVSFLVPVFTVPIFVLRKIAEAARGLVHAGTKLVGVSAVVGALWWMVQVVLALLLNMGRS